MQGDVNWNADDGTLGLKAIFGAHLGVLGSGDYNTYQHRRGEYQFGQPQLDPANGTQPRTAGRHLHR